MTKRIQTKALWKNKKRELDRWTPGMPIPGVLEAREHAREGENTKSEDTSEPTESEEEQDDEEDAHLRLVCSTAFGKPNQLQYHCDEEHSVRDPDIVTVLSHQHELRKKNYARRHQLYKHKGWKLNWRVEPNAEPCGAKAAAIDRRDDIGTGGWLETLEGPELSPPERWWIATDGSGTQNAGWGVVIFRMPL